MVNDHSAMLAFNDGRTSSTTLIQDEDEIRLVGCHGGPFLFCVNSIALVYEMDVDLVTLKTQQYESVTQNRAGRYAICILVWNDQCSRLRCCTEMR